MRTIEAVDFFYLSMPTVLDIGDGSQDALLVRVAAGDQVGWGECEASPLVTIASLVCPMSHSACKPVSDSVLGQRLETPADIARIHQAVRRNSMDLLQADHALSGIDVALWDLLGKIHQQPVYRLLGYPRAYPKRPYSSLLFGAHPQETLQKARRARQAGFRAVKFGWGGFGQRSVKEDEEQVAAAREGLGADGVLCIDAGAVWGSDLEAARQRLPMLEAFHVTWLEEPFHTHALSAYHNLARLSHKVRLAGGEGAHNEHMAQQMIDYAGVGFIQIDPGRIGGITSAKRVFDYAHARGVTFINHTFTSHLALSAALHVYAGAAGHELGEYPGQLTPLASELTREHLLPDANGHIHLPERPGLGIQLDMQAVRKYLVETHIEVNGRVLYHTPVV
ncbi:MAG: mandelate racemase/muconate lactonizing enzyme family protein [Bellilinea sp.]|jgi:L-alanine-DL-glutamate epimerase-like enolase superfamily enzyme